MQEKITIQWGKKVSEITNNISSRIKELRKANNMTQEELAKKLLVKRSCISNWETGVRSPEYRYVVQLARVFTVPIDYIYGKTNHKYNVKIPHYFNMDLSRLNKYGLKRLWEYYELLLKDEKFCK